MGPAKDRTRGAAREARTVAPPAPREGAMHPAGTALLQAVTRRSTPALRATRRLPRRTELRRGATPRSKPAAPDPVPAAADRAPAVARAAAADRARAAAAAPAPEAAAGQARAAPRATAA